MKLNLGAGKSRLPGFVSVDLHNAEVVHDLRRFPWPFAADSVTEIVASHVLEHLDRRAGLGFLAECERILARDGVLHLAVPDFDIFADCLVSGDWRPLAGYSWRDANHFFGGDGRELFEHNKHRYAYTYGDLAYKLYDAGFFSVKRRGGPCDFDNLSYAPISLYLDAWK